MYRFSVLLTTNKKYPDDRQASEDILVSESERMVKPPLGIMGKGRVMSAVYLRGRDRSQCLAWMLNRFGDIATFSTVGAQR